MMESPVLVTKNDSSLVISLSRPATRNALDMDMRKALAEAVLIAKDDASVKVVILTGAGGTFCAGGDLNSMKNRVNHPVSDRDRVRRLHPWFRELVNLEKPVIGAIEGAAYGAGLNLALACDFVLVSSKVRFSAVFGKIGLIPDLGGLFLLPRIVGLQRAKELVFSAREFGAQEAKELGIAYAIHEPGTVLDEAHTLAKHLANASTFAIGAAKNILNRSFNLDQDTLAELEAYAQSVAMQTEYHSDAVDRFVSKKTLAFTRG